MQLQLKNLQHINFGLNILCHLVLAYILFTGSWANIACAFLIYVFIGMNEQSFYHRLYTHKSWDCPQWLKAIGLHIAALSLLAPVIPWVSLHREHHRFFDTEKDPHSPLHMPRFDVQFKSSYFHFNTRYGVDLMRDKLCKFYTVYYFEVIFATWAAIFLLFGLDALFVWLAGTSISILSANTINSITHGKQNWLWQYQLYKVNDTDTSQNDMLLGYLGFDGWHNNHHAAPGKYYYGDRWWEIDLAGIYIWFLATVTGYRHSLVK
jgi:stearoyl-CoA desaturase (delta-9 desaturase)